MVAAVAVADIREAQRVADIQSVAEDIRDNLRGIQDNLDIRADQQAEDIQSVAEDIRDNLRGIQDNLDIREDQLKDIQWVGIQANQASGALTNQAIQFVVGIQLGFVATTIHGQFGIILSSHVQCLDGNGQRLVL
jgi:Cu/Ag efflux pump CusA